MGEHDGTSFNNQLFYFTIVDEDVWNVAIETTGEDETD